MRIKCVNKLSPVITKKKRVKILVGGRGSTKSTFTADYVLSCVANGQLWCCGRQFQNSIDESVHRLLQEEIERLGFTGFYSDKTSISHESGGRIFYRGLERNVKSMKSMLSGVDGLWIEEGEDLSDNTITVLTASLRVSAKDADRLFAGEDIKMPEIIITMNRGSSADPVAIKWLKRAENDLERRGYYEDEALLVIEINYTDMPKSWFLASGLEVERADDFKNMSRAKYDHKWKGKYLDTVDNAIIEPEWFDAALDAHKLPHLSAMFEPHGAIIAAHDPFDDGGDAAGYAVRHGSIILEVRCKEHGEIDEVCDWATGQAREINADWFVWDGDGMGTGLKRQVSEAFKGTATKFHMFKGSLSGKGQDNADKLYMPTAGDRDSKKKPKTYADTFKNNRAQYYAELARLFKNTYDCVIKGKYFDPADMISFDTDGIDDLASVRSQICRIPLKPNAQGLIQIMSKEEMKRLKIKSPNEADAVMMTIYFPPADDEVVNGQLLTQLGPAQVADLAVLNILRVA